MDVRAMTVPTAFFDVAIDKGTLDAMQYGTLRDPEDKVKANVKAYLDEVVRFLRPEGGKWLCVTYRQPHSLQPISESKGERSMDAEVLGGEDGSFAYFGFAVTKNGWRKGGRTGRIPATPLPRAFLKLLPPSTS